MHSLVASLALVGLLAFAGADASPLSVDEKIRNTLQLDQNPRRGEQLYANYCSNCHGPKALGSATNIIPALAGQRRAYLVKQFADFSEMERASRAMAAAWSWARRSFKINVPAATRKMLAATTTVLFLRCAISTIPI